MAPEKIQQQVERGSARGGQGAAVSQPIGAGAGGGTIFTEPILVVNQKAKIFEVTNQYGVFDRTGIQIASVNQVGQSTAKKALRLFTSLDQFLTHKLEIRDIDGQVQLLIIRPAKVFKSTVLVHDATGQEIGRIVQDNIFGKIHFTLQAGGDTLGSINAENWRAWNFRIDDAAGTEVGPHHQDVRGHREDDVHHRRQLRRADSRPVAATLPLAGRGQLPLGRHCAQAGHGRSRLNDAGVLVTRRQHGPPPRWRAVRVSARNLS